MKDLQFEKITIRVLSEKAGISRTAFYNHYRTKEALVTDYWYDQMEVLQHQIDDVWRGRTEREICQIFCDFWRKNGEILLAMIRHGKCTFARYSIQRSVFRVVDYQLQRLPSSEAQDRLALILGGLTQELLGWWQSGFAETNDRVAQRMRNFIDRECVA